LARISTGDTYVLSTCASIVAQAITPTASNYSHTVRVIDSAGDRGTRSRCNCTCFAGTITGLIATISIFADSRCALIVSVTFSPINVPARSGNITDTPGPITSHGTKTFGAISGAEHRGTDARRVSARLAG